MALRITPLDADQAIEAVGETADGDGPILHALIEGGEAEAWSVNDGALNLITRIETRPDRRELVVCCAKGEALDELIPVIESAAAKAECDTIRWHTKRKGLARYVDRYSSEPVEYVETVYRVEVPA